MTLEDLTKGELAALVSALAALAGYLARGLKGFAVAWWHRVWSDVEEEQDATKRRIQEVEGRLTGRIDRLEAQVKERMRSVEDSLVQSLDEESEARRREVAEVRLAVRESVDDLKDEMRDTRKEVVTQLETIRQAIMRQ